MAIIRLMQKLGVIPDDVSNFMQQSTKQRVEGQNQLQQGMIPPGMMPQGGMMPGSAMGMMPGSNPMDLLQMQQMQQMQQMFLQQGKQWYCIIIYHV